MGYFKKLNAEGKKRSVFRLDVKEFTKTMNAYVSGVDRGDVVKVAIRAGAQSVVNYVRKRTTPKSKKVHYYQASFGRKIAIHPGNLLKSTRKYFTKRKEYEVGPKVLRKMPDDLGKTVYTSSGYYASMVYGSAAEFRRRILEPALNQPVVSNAIESAFAKWHKKFFSS